MGSNPNRRSGRTGAETRIDGVLTDPRVAYLVHEDRVVRKPGFPGHSLLRVDINLNMSCEQVTKIRRLEEPLKHDMHMTEYHGLAEAFWDRSQSAKRTLMRCGARGRGQRRSFCC